MYRNNEHDINITKEFYEYLCKGHIYNNGKVTLTHKDFEEVTK